MIEAVSRAGRLRVVVPVTSVARAKNLPDLFALQCVVMKRLRSGVLPRLIQVSSGLVLGTLLVFGSTAIAAEKPATVFQFSTLPALSSGRYEGELTFGELLKHGDFGLGTFDALDGELVILKGKAWRACADGRVLPVENKVTTPFALVTRFMPDHTLKITQPTAYSELQKQIPQLYPTNNAIYAVEISGVFSHIQVRSVPGQAKPYPPLAEVVKKQSVWEWQNVRGTLVGFRFPSYLSGVNLADLHFHFIADDKKHGGHLLDCELQEGQIRVQTVRGFDLRLPAGPEFDRADLGTDQSAALKATEQAGGK